MARLTVVGSSDAFNSAGRSHSSYLVEGPGYGPLMIDFGATSLAALRRIGREPTELRGIAITHLHGDHVGGFPFLVIDGMFNAIRTEPLEILGPVGTADRIAALTRIAYGSIADHPLPFELRVRELLPGQEEEIVGVRVRGFSALHMDLPEVPLCLRCTTPDGRTIAFSGDTQICDGLFEAGDRADLLVAECTGMKPPIGRHISFEEWTTAWPRVTAKRLLLTHLSAEVRRLAPSLTVPDNTSFAEDAQVIAL